ncbi:MAG: hypothetical protein ACYDD1_11260 [Caulobacteraceae bacterium]
MNVGTGGVQGTQIVADTTASAAPTPANITIFRDNTSYNARTLDFVGFGGSGGAGASYTQVGVLRNVRRRYLTNIGVAVQ